MKKTKTKLIAIISIALIAGMIFSTGCGKKKTEDTVKPMDKVIFNTNMSVCDVYIFDGERYGLPIPYAYKGDYPDIEFVRAEGENIESAKLIKIVNDEEQSTVPEYDGYKVGTMGLIVGLGDKEITVTDIVVKVDGEEKNIHMASPAIYRPQGANNDALKAQDYSQVMSATFMSQLFGGTMKASKDIEITGIEAYGPFDIELDQLDENTRFDIPYKVKKGEEVSFMSHVRYKEGVRYCVGNVIVKYTDGENQKELKLAFTSGADEAALMTIVKNIVEDAAE